MVLGTVGGNARAFDEPKPALHARIDHFMEAGVESGLAAPSTDAEFLRRLYLDLTGMIPSATEARAFLDDPSPYKRARLVDDLLNSTAFVRHMTNVFDVTWMERRGDMHVPAAEWRAFLFDCFARGLGLDEITRLILSADGSEPGNRGASKFFLDREAEPHLLVRDVGRLFLGRDLQCAQCHDHPLVDDYKQAHYYGLFAFFNRSYLAADARGLMTLGEKCEGEATFSSVFKKEDPHTTGPHILDQSPPDEPALVKGLEYYAYPVEKLPGRPRHSRRVGLAARITDPSVVDFRLNLANRLWALMMGRGLVHPLDMAHTDNPPSHPELLELLADALYSADYDVRLYLRELALTRTYQRSSEPSPDVPEEALAPERFTTAAVRPLTPEQMGWSIMRAVGVVEAQRAELERMQLEVDTRLRDIARLDEARARLVALRIEKLLDDRLRGHVEPFVRQFGAGQGQAQDGGQSTIHQALFLSNGEPLQSWLNPAGQNLTARLGALSDDSQLAEELYLSVLTRRPSAEERAEVSRYLSERGEQRPAAIRELAWALLSSAEFRFNH